MTCKIERIVSGGDTVIFRVCGRIQVEHLSAIAELIGQESQPIRFDLEEMQLVDREAVSFLAACELNGITLTNCPAFLREWVTEEKRRAIQSFEI
jgi:hypothetical protein